MIVDPDFFDHWRTRMVADMLQDQLAPIYIMRLWAHCQNRKGDVFDIPAAGLKALCQYPGTAQCLEDALIAADYIERDGLTVTVTGWAEKNASLIAAWENGGKGGRPKKNPMATDGQPNENPAETHGKPTANPPKTQAKPIREEKRREEEETPQPPAGAFEEFWKCWPANDRKQDRGKCLERWKREKLEAVSARILADVQAKKLSKKWLEGFVESPLVYLNNRRWEDGAGDGAKATPKGDIDAYCATHRNAAWWADAGFANVYEATSSKCFHHNAAQFRDGKKCEVAA